MKWVKYVCAAHTVHKAEVNKLSMAWEVGTICSTQSPLALESAPESSPQGSLYSKF